MESKNEVVVGELLTKPSMVVPTLFVGLGGCGGSLIRRVADHLEKRSDFEERYKRLTKFAFVDTNINDMEKHREKADETFLISDFEKSDYSALASGRGYLDPDPYFTQWVPQNYRFRAGDTAGAGQIRIESRLGCYYQVKHRDFVPRFRRLLDELKSHDTGHRRLDTGEVRIVLCYSVAGGTGSGSHLPIAYLLRDLAQQVGKPSIIGVAVLPSVFEDKIGSNKDGTFANGYAALKETEYLMKLGAPESRFFPSEGRAFHYNPADTSKRVVSDKPFDFLYVVDRPESMSIGKIVDAAGDGLYLQLFSPLFKEQAGDYDNFTQHQRFLVPHDFEGKAIEGFTSFYGSYGAAVFHVPEEGLVAYCSQAASLRLFRSSFLGNIPAEPVYSRLHTNDEEFYHVTVSDDRRESISEHKFRDREENERERLEDRLFLKRVRLLAHCEHENQATGRYTTCFRHGHRLGARPQASGDVVEGSPEKLEQEEVARKGLEYSIGHVVLAAVLPSASNSDAKLLEHAKAEIRRAASAKKEEAPREKRSAADVVSDAQGHLGDLVLAGRQALKKGAGAGAARLLGFSELDDLGFLGSHATPTVRTVEKRYAALSIRDALSKAYGKKLAEPPAKPRPPSEAPDGGDLKGDALKARWDDAIEAVSKAAITQISEEFFEGIRNLVKALEENAKVYRKLQAGFVEIEESRRGELERLRKEGDERANRYVLDSEALQMESGRRLWDFYYEDVIADDRDVTLDNKVLADLFVHTVEGLARSRSAGTAATSELYDKVVTEIAALVGPKILGDLHSPDTVKKYGLTLTRALELEVEYRAVYLSNRDAIDADPTGEEVRRVLVQHKSMRSPVSLKQSEHMDYLRDKMKRVVKEKSDLFCLLDGKHLQQGGVRPARVFLAAISKELERGIIGEALKQAGGSELKVVTDEWTSLKEIIIYRALLNVPLYAFGRMNEMKSYYHQFRNMARRSKALHIDKNWEDKLPDLDPADLEAEYRDRLVREQVIDFAALMSFQLPSGAGTGVVRRDGAYYLQSMDESLTWEDGMEEAAAPVRLGDTLLHAISRLPDAMAAESVRFGPYKPLLAAVRAGFAPALLAEIAVLPARWKYNAENLRNRFGSKLDPAQHEKIDDYDRASRRLFEALSGLLEQVRNHQAERKATGESREGVLEVGGVMKSDRDIDLLVDQSLAILVRFVDSWQSRERTKHLSAGLADIFRPLDQEKLKRALESLSEGVTGRPGASHEPKKTPGAQG